MSKEFILDKDKISVTGLLQPSDPKDTYPITDPTYQKGGWRICASVEDMNSIPEARRSNGMVVIIPNNKNPYVYQYINNEFLLIENFNLKSMSTDPDSIDTLDGTELISVAAFESIIYPIITDMIISQSIYTIFYCIKKYVPNYIFRYGELIVDLNPDMFEISFYLCTQQIPENEYIPITNTDYFEPLKVINMLGSGDGSASKIFDYVLNTEPAIDISTEGKLWLNTDPNDENYGNIFKCVNSSWVNCNGIEKYLNYRIVDSIETMTNTPDKKQGFLFYCIDNEKLYIYDGYLFQELLVGQQGIQGPKGDQGEPGPQGEPGETQDLSNYFTKEEVDNFIVGKDYITNNESENLIKKTSITPYEQGVTYNIGSVVCLIGTNNITFFEAIANTQSNPTVETDWKKLNIEVELPLDDLVNINDKQSIIGEKEFLKIPKSSGIPNIDDHLVNFKYVNDIYAKKSDINEAIHFRGSCEEFSELNDIESAISGDMYIVRYMDSGGNKAGSYIYNGTDWIYTGESTINLQAIKDSLPFNIHPSGKCWFTSIEYNNLSTAEKNNGKMYIIQD